MRKSFEFIPVQTDRGTVLRPLLEVGVDYRGESQRHDFLVDSGADYSLMGKDSAGLLGMELEGGPKHDVYGILGKVVCFGRKVSLAVPGFDSHPFESTVYVSPRLKHNLLGRDNFFLHFRVGFDLKEKTLILDDRKE